MRKGDNGATIFKIIWERRTGIHVFKGNLLDRNPRETRSLNNKVFAPIYSSQLLYASSLSTAHIRFITFILTMVVVGFCFFIFVRQLGGKSGGRRVKCRVYYWKLSWGILGGGSTNSDCKGRRARLIVGLLHIWELNPPAPLIRLVRIEVVKHPHDPAMST